MFAGAEDVDEQGRYLYVDWRDTPGLPPELLAPDANLASAPLEPLPETGMYDFLRTLSPEDVEGVLLRFSEIHFDLVALSSPDLRARMEAIRRNETPYVSTEVRLRDLQEALNGRPR